MNNSNIYNNLYARYFSKLCLAFIVAYFIFQIFIVSYVLNGANIDDAEQLVNTSFFALGYGGSQPPLYTWLTLLIFKIFGVSLFSLQLVKFGLLSLTFLGVYCAFRLLGFSYLVAAVAMLSLFLLPQIGWESQRALSHSVIGTAACAWLLVAFAYYMKKNTIISAIFLGIMLACSALGKFNDCLFIAALFFAGLTIKNYRPILLSFKTIIAFVVAALLLAAPINWMLAHKSAMLERTGKFALSANKNPFLDRLWGTADLILACLAFIYPIIIVSAIFYWLDKKKRITDTADKTDGQNLIFRIIMIGILLTWVIVLFSGATNVKDRWMQPVLFLSAPAFIIFFAYKLYPQKTLRRFAYFSMTAAVIFMALLANYFTATFFIKNDPNISFFDYKSIFERIEKTGEIKTIVGSDFAISGNMRLLDPTLKALSVENPSAAENITLPAIIIWVHKGEYGHLMPIKIRKALDDAGLFVNGDPELIKDVPYIGHPNNKKNVYFYRINK